MQMIASESDEITEQKGVSCDEEDFMAVDESSDSSLGVQNDQSSRSVTSIEPSMPLSTTVRIHA